MQNDNLKSYLHLHLIVFIWGFTAVLGALISLDALPLVWWRMAIATTIILLFIGWKKIPLRLTKKAILFMILAGLVIALHWLTFFKAIKVSNVSVTLGVFIDWSFFCFFFGAVIVW